MTASAPPRPSEVGVVPYKNGVETFSDTPHPLHLAGVAAQTDLIGHSFKNRLPVAKSEALVGVPEELGVREARPKYPLVPLPNQALRVRLHVEHGHKVRSQIPLLVLNGEVLLVIAHHGNQDFARQMKKAFVEASEHGARPLGGIGDPIHQPLILDNLAGGLLHHRQRFLNDAVPTLVVVDFY